MLKLFEELKFVLTVNGCPQATVAQHIRFKDFQFYKSSVLRVVDLLRL